MVDVSTHSKGKYVAFRSGRNAPTNREKIHRERIRIAEELARFNAEPFPNGATIAEWNGVDGGMNPDGTIGRHVI